MMEDIVEKYIKDGDLYCKHEDWQHAINSYQRAIEIDPNCSAQEALTQIYEILDFYNKDLFNQ